MQSSPMRFALQRCIFVGLLISSASGHSVLTDPQPFHPAECRQGGPGSNIKHCSGPCLIDRLKQRHPALNYYPPDKPAAAWRRGSNVTVRYARNNHAPGGFVRLTLVPIGDMMNKRVHERNAFHFSCWGGHPRRATSSERKSDQYGFSRIGSDGRFNVSAGYYTDVVRVPTAVPDGKYVLGWVWYGGTGGKVLDNTPQRPKEKSYFGDYWSCAFVRIQGGPLAADRPRFVNTMSQFSKDGCMASTDRPGVCTREPCKGRTGSYQKPFEFKLEAPPMLVPDQFRSRNMSAGTVRVAKRKGMQTGFGWNDWGVREYPTPSPSAQRYKPVQQSFAQWDWLKRRASFGAGACKCLHASSRCTSTYARSTSCYAGSFRSNQPDSCFDECCTYCTYNDSPYCRYLGISSGC